MDMLNVPDGRHLGGLFGGRPASDDSIPVNGHAKREVVNGTGMDMHIVLPVQDKVALHLLADNAIHDSANYQILTPESVERLKREITSTESRVDALKRRITLESKVRDATSSIGKLSQKQASEAAEVAARVAKLEEELSPLESQYESSRRKLLEHTAAVLAKVHKDKQEPEILSPDVYGQPLEKVRGFDALSYYHPHTTFTEDGIIDLSEPPAKIDASQYDQLVSSVERQVDSLNSRLRDMILEFNPANEELPEPPISRDRASRGPEQALNDNIAFSQACLDSLHSLQVRTRNAPLHAALHHDEAIIDAERQIEKLSERVSELVLDFNPDRDDLPLPPEIPEEHEADPLALFTSYAAFINDCLILMRRLKDQQPPSIHPVADPDVGRYLTQLGQVLYQAMCAANPERAGNFSGPPDGEDEDQIAELFEYLESGIQMLGQSGMGAGKVSALQNQLDQYFSTMVGLWDIISSSEVSRGPGDSITQEFSLKAFSTKVQTIYHRATELQEHKDVLSRQIKQQRELNDTADAAKDKQITDMTEELGKSRTRNDTLASETAQHLANLTASTSALTALQSQHDALKAAHDSRAAEVANGTTAIASLEGQVAHLQTELTIAKADLETAHGSRAERAAQAAADPVLTGRIATLEKELSETIADYEAMTKATIEYEKEREQLELTMDRLRDRSDELEGELAEAKIAALGSKSPGLGSDKGGGNGTGMGILRSEFRRMMREMQNEHRRAMRGEQEERRKLEAQLRQLRQPPGRT